MGISRFSLNCPHCKSYAATRTSRTVTPLYREIYLQCTNVLCGHTYKVGISVICTLSPAADPDPKIKIPVVLKRRTEKLPPPANDDLPDDADQVAASAANDAGGDADTVQADGDQAEAVRA